MKPLFKCDIEFNQCPHLMQLYTGFFELERKGVIELSLKKVKANVFNQTMSAVVNNQFKVIYDAADGFNWITGSIEDNLNYFRQAFDADFIFKRSYNKVLLDYLPTGVALFPLGLNYNIQPYKNLSFLQSSMKAELKYFFKTNKLINKVVKKNYFYTTDFEYYPVQPSDKKILFLTRLWNPTEARSNHSISHRQLINENRIECVKTCKQEFGNLFTGGLIMDEFTTRNYPSLAAPKHLTSKFGYLQSVKDHLICIATTGLHDSIGWKFAEYVAASRAIISEPLKYELPGEFSEGRNYLEFSTPEELVKQINSLRRNESLLSEMMHNNFHYYNNYLKPEILILNTLLKVSKYQ